MDYNSYNPSFLCMSNYLIVWIPNIFKSEDFIRHPLRVKIQDNISDSKPFYVKLELNSNYDIKVLICDPEIHGENFVEFSILHLLDSNPNGLVKYSFEDSVYNPDGFALTIDYFPEVVVQMIKNLYHKDEFHLYKKTQEDAEDDESVLCVMLSSEDVDLKDPGNKAVEHYLKEYEESIRIFIKNARRLLEELRHRVAGSPDLATFYGFPEIYNSILGYNSYFKTIYEEYLDPVKCPQNLKLLVFNIVNSLEYFKALNVFFDTQIRRVHNDNLLKKAQENIIRSDDILTRNEAILELSAQNNLRSEEILRKHEESIDKTNENLRQTGDVLEKTETLLDKARTSEKKTKKYNNIAFGLSIFSILLGLASIIISFCLSDQSKKDLDAATNELKEFINRGKLILNSLPENFGQPQSADSTLNQWEMSIKEFNMDSIMKLNNVKDNPSEITVPSP